MHQKAILQKAKDGRYWVASACLVLMTLAGCESGRTSAEDEKLKELDLRVQLLESRVEAMLDQSAKEMARKDAENQGFTVRELRPALTGHDAGKFSPDGEEDAKPDPPTLQE